MEHFTNGISAHDTIRLSAVLLFSLIVPIGIFVGRSNIRLSRRELVRDLERLFNFANCDGRPLILPSFELVKYKYDPDPSNERQNTKDTANAFRYYIFPVMIYICMTGA